MFNLNASSLRQINTQQQTPVRQTGFGVRFKDTPPTFIKETKEDNKIERKEKPKCPKGHKVCKCKKNKNKIK
tara:strand:- start:208 stop:423 length:216 start_codon:yes stop_codon:yes gene_type:complete